MSWTDVLWVWIALDCVIVLFLVWGAYIRRWKCSKEES